MDKNKFEELLKLARLDIDSNDKDEFYQKWLNCMDVLSSIVEFDEDYKPLYTVNEAYEKPALDETKEGLSLDDALKNANDKKYGYFQVKKYV